MIHFHSLETPQLERFLERHKAGLSLKNEVDLDLVLRQILQKAFEFVPSESGSILLDDPFRKLASRKDNELVFIATFGDSSRNLVGTRLPAQHGIVGPRLPDRDAVPLRRRGEGPVLLRAISTHRSATRRTRSWPCRSTSASTSAACWS